MNAIAKRKTVTSSEVKARWNAKTYKAYGIHLRKEEDGDLIEYVEQRKANGDGTTDIFREALEELKNKG